MFVCRQVDWRKIASLTMSAVSSSFRAHFSMHSLKSAISLSLKLLLLLHQPRLARNPYSGLELGPTHASLRSRTAIMITTSNSSSYEEEAGRPINYSVFDCTPWRCPGCPACEPNLTHC